METNRSNKSYWKSVFTFRQTVIAIVLTNLIFGNCVYMYIRMKHEPLEKISGFFEKAFFFVFGFFKGNYVSFGENCPIFRLGTIPETTLYLITPTRFRLEQRADLTRLSQTLRLVPNLHWVVVEDSKKISPNIHNLLRKLCVRFTHLNTTTDPSLRNARGGTQRNFGLNWIREQYMYDNGTLKSEKPPDAVVFFADDDNTYDVRLFEKMRKIKKVGIWAVGLVGGSLVETPEILNGTVVKWLTAYAPGRTFATDMAGFAFHLSLALKYRDAKFHSRCYAGLIETCFLDQLKIKRKELEPIGFDEPYGKREILVWHTRTKSAGNRQGDKGFIVV